MFSACYQYVQLQCILAVASTGPRSYDSRKNTRNGEQSISHVHLLSTEDHGSSSKVEEEPWQQILEEGNSVVWVSQQGC